MTHLLSRRSIGVALGLSGSLLGACFTTAADGNLMSDRLTRLERSHEEQQETARTKVAELEEVLVRATELVTRNSADTGAQVESLAHQMMVLEGQLAELRNEAQRQQTQFAEQQTAMEQQLKRLAQHAGLEPTLEEHDIPAGADAHWAAADQAYSDRQYPRARALLRAFAQRHAQDARADDAQYRIGASFLEENRPATALGELRAVISEHPQGDAADDALLAMARAFYALHACTDARSALEAFPRAHARSPLLDQSRELLRTVNRAPRGYCTR